MELSCLNELFFEHNCVASMTIEMVDRKYNLTLTMTSSREPEAEGVAAVFRDVSRLSLSGFGGPWLDRTRMVLRQRGVGNVG